MFTFSFRPKLCPQSRGVSYDMMENSSCSSSDDSMHSKSNFFHLNKLWLSIWIYATITIFPLIRVSSRSLWFDCVHRLTLRWWRRISLTDEKWKQKPMENRIKWISPRMLLPCTYAFSVYSHNFPRFLSYFLFIRLLLCFPFFTFYLQTIFNFEYIPVYCQHNDY